MAKRFNHPDRKPITDLLREGGDTPPRFIPEPRPGEGVLAPNLAQDLERKLSAALTVLREKKDELHQWQTNHRDLKHMYDVNVLRLRELDHEVRMLRLELERARNAPLVWREGMGPGPQLDGAPKELTGTRQKLLATAIASNVSFLLIGPAGCGKSVSVERVAKFLGLPCYVYTPVQFATEITGWLDGHSNRVRVDFEQAWTEGGLVFFDEIDAADPQALLTLNATTSASVFSFCGHRVPRHPNFRVGAAANTRGLGADSVYVGRNRLDGSTLDRYGLKIPFDYDRDFELALVGDCPWGKKFLDVVWAFRAHVKHKSLPYVVSTRTLLNGLAIREHLSIPDATSYLILEGWGEEDARIAQQTLERTWRN